jgi:uncharacterized protein
VVVALVGSTSLGATSCRREPDASRPAAPVLRFATGPVGGGFYAFGEALVTALAVIHPDVKIARPPSGGVLSNLEEIQRGAVDLGFAFADVAYLAANGQLQPGTQAFDRLRAVAVVQLTPVQLVASGGSEIRTIGDLRGRHVAVGPEGSGTALTARLILSAFGLTGNDIRQYSLEFQNAGERIAKRSLDAMFDNAQYAESIAAALKQGAYLVPIEGPGVIRLRQEYPFLRPMLLPAGTYGDSPPIATVGVDSLIICRSDLDEQVVHDFTVGLFRALAELSKSGRWNLVDLTNAPATSLRLHDGAARYYREQELVR